MRAAVQTGACVLVCADFMILPLPDDAGPDTKENLKPQRDRWPDETATKSLSSAYLSCITIRLLVC